jgi:hypothetical protein
LFRYVLFRYVLGSIVTYGIKNVAIIESHVALHGRGTLHNQSFA